jgi:hypothetical protein
MKPLWAAGVEQAKGDFKRYNKLNTMLLKSLLCNMCIDFMIMKKCCCPLYHIAMHRGVHTYRKKKKKKERKKWKGYHSTPVHTIS